MGVLQLLSVEKKRWLQQQLQAKGFELNLEKSLTEQLSEIPNEMINQLLSEVRALTPSGMDRLTDINAKLMSYKIAKVGKQEMCPQQFYQFVVNNRS